MYRLLTILYLFVFGTAGAQLQSQRLSTVELKTLDGKKHLFNSAEEISVVVFLSPSCPLSQKYTLTINELSEEFDSSVKFYGVFAETHPDLNEYEDFRKKYQTQFELLVDNKKKLVRSLSATVTPEAFVFHKEKLIYHGAIDDWAIELGKTKKKATVNFVRNAIQCVIDNTIPVSHYNKPIGCFID